MGRYRAVSDRYSGTGEELLIPGRNMNSPRTKHHSAQQTESWKGKDQLGPPSDIDEDEKNNDASAVQGKNGDLLTSKGLRR